jgi:enterobactin synthetase component F
MTHVPGHGAPQAGVAARTPRPLTEAQAAMWFAQRLAPDNPVFNTAQYVDLRGPLDRDAFALAVNRAVDEAEGLALRVVDDPAGPLAVVEPRRTPHLRITDLRDSSDPWAEAQRQMHLDHTTAVDPATMPLATEVLFVLADDHHVWYQRIHHLAIDGYGTAMLTERVCDLYAQTVGGTAPRTQPFGGLADVFDADAEYLASERAEADRRYWHEQLRDAPPVQGLAAGTPTTAGWYRQHRVDLPDEGREALAALSERVRVPWPDVLAALVAAYVSRLVSSDDVTIGLAHMARMGTPAARVPAMVMNILPVRLRVAEDVPVAEWLKAAAATMRQARRHSRYRAERLRRELGRLGGDKRLYGVLVNVLPFDQPLRLPGLTATVTELATGPVDDLHVTARADTRLSQLRLDIDANPLLYTAEALDAHAARLAAWLTRAAAASTLAEVPVVTDAEREQLLVTFNDTRHDVPAVTLAALLDDAYRRHAASPALVADGRTFDYAALDRATARLMTALHDSGVRRGHVVAVALPRSPELVVALHAIVRMGAAYLPLDLDHPLERTRRILSSAQPALVVARGSFAADGHTVLHIGDVDLWSAVDSGRREAHAERPSLDDAAYVIYTSGSTGEPKGVVVEHRAIVNRLLWMREAYGVRPSDRIVQKTPATFDVSVWEFFLPALAGAALVVAAPGAHRDPAALRDLFRSSGATIAHFVPSMLAEYLEEPGAGQVPLRAVICSGEALPASLRDRFHATLRAELHNLYGPTEAAVDVTAWDASRHDDSVPVPIGRPVWNTRLYVLDAKDRLVPAGFPGELCLAGVQLARGYLGRPDLTAERFVPDPFVEGERMYRTGDIARWRPDGAVEYLGRADFQVKIRGQRIELGEIDAAIAAHLPVVRNETVVREDHPGDRRLVTYVQTRDGAALDVAAWRAVLAERLPAAMVPWTFVAMDTWPTTANGKLDRHRLPKPVVPRSGSGAALGPLEREVAACVAKVVHVDANALSPDDDFFALGGDSLGAAELTRLMRETLDVDMDLGAVFTQPTVAGLARWVEARRADAADAADRQSLHPLIQLREGGSDQPPLVCVHPAGGLAWCYHGIVRRLAPGRTVLGLQARALDAGTRPPASLDELADDYIALVTAAVGDGPMHLLGWSIGGIIAQAMAARLEAAGREVGVLAVLDAYPSDRWRGMDDPDESAALRALLLMAGEDPQVVGGRLTREPVIARLRAGRHPLGVLPDDTLTAIVRVVEHNNRLVRRHAHAPCRAPMLHFTATLEHLVDGASPDEWRPYVGGLEVIPVSAIHAHMTGPQVAPLVAATLEERMRR